MPNITKKLLCKFRENLYFRKDRRTNRRMEERQTGWTVRQTEGQRDPNKSRQTFQAMTGVPIKHLPTFAKE